MRSSTLKRQKTFKVVIELHDFAIAKMAKTPIVNHNTF
jgi:hypothetical protein